MPKKRFKIYDLRFTIICLLAVFIMLLVTPRVYAQTAPASCDLCGWCGTETADKPADWANCMSCLFPATVINGANKPAANSNYPSYPETSKNWTIVGCIDTAPGGSVSQIYKIIVSISGGAALLAFIFGGFKVLTAGGDKQRMDSGKSMIMGALMGLLIIVFSVFLLKLIGYEIIKLPGFN